MINIEEFLTNLHLPTEPPSYSPNQSMDGLPDDRPNRQARLRQLGVVLDSHPMITLEEFRYHYEGTPNIEENHPNG